MATIKMDDEQSLNLYMQDFRTKFISMNEEVSNQEIKDLYKEYLKKLTDNWSRKYRDGERMIETVQELRNEIRLQNKQIEEKQELLLEDITKIKPNETMNAELAQHLQELKEELNKKRELALINKKANKDRLKQLQESVTLFTNRLGLEIRRLKGDKLQIVFRCIDPKNLNQPYSCILSLTEEGQYEVTGFDPPLEGRTEIEKQVRETQNFSSLLTNLRKAFAELCSQGK